MVLAGGFTAAHGAPKPPAKRAVKMANAGLPATGKGGVADGLVTLRAEHKASHETSRGG